MTVTHFGLLSRTPATHCISQVEKLFIIHLICHSTQNFSGCAALTMEPTGIKRVSPGVFLVEPATYQPIKKKRKKKERGYTIANKKIALLYLGKI